MFEKRSEVVRQSSIVLSEYALTKSIQLGLCDHEDNPSTNLSAILWLSVQTQHIKGNRRYNDWIFFVKSNVLKDVHLVQCTNCDDLRRLVVYDECSYCYGDKCAKCKYTGQRKSSIPCPSCSAN